MPSWGIIHASVIARLSSLVHASSPGSDRIGQGVAVIDFLIAFDRAVATRPSANIRNPTPS
jgi:hypothetical protein